MQGTICAGDMINFRCMAGEGRGVTGERAGKEGSAAPVRFGSAKEASDFATTQNGTPGEVTLATEGATVVRLEMPNADADAILKRICK